MGIVDKYSLTLFYVHKWVLSDNNSAVEVVDFSIVIKYFDRIEIIKYLY